MILLHHLGSDVSASSILGPLKAAGIEVEIRPRSAVFAEDVRDTLSFLNRHSGCSCLTASARCILRPPRRRAGAAVGDDNPF